MQPASKRSPTVVAVDVVYDAVGKSTWDKSLQCLRKYGLMVSFGNASGKVPPLDLSVLGGHLFLTRPSLMPYTASREELEMTANDLVMMVGSGKIKINIEQRFGLDEVVKAHESMEARKTTGCSIPVAMTSVSRQFASTARLFSEEAFLRLRQAHIGVVGLGGVGSWAAEALARSGVGRLTLVDMDVVAEGNLNRQAQASHQTKGMAKVQAMAQRIEAINPKAQLTLVDAFLSLENIDEIFW